MIDMAAPRGRKPGLILNSEAFEAVIASRNFLKSHVARDAGIAPGFLSDLLVPRGGATLEVAEHLAATIGVKPGALFPELVGFTYTDLIVRKAKRSET